MIQMIKTALRQIKRKKYRVFWKYIAGPVYRAECNELVQIKSNLTGRKKQQFIPLGNVLPGHKVVYPEWVRILEQRIQSSQRIEPIDVVEVIPDVYITVDGNHRLTAMTNKMHAEEKILVNIMEKRSS